MRSIYELSEKTRRIILWSVTIAVGLALLVWWSGIVKTRWENVETESVIDQLIP
ncbi:MAG: hypothetical protein Q8P70_01085 [bacterium]|nr:hypothetical protein [bacterium]